LVVATRRDPQQKSRFSQGPFEDGIGSVPQNCAHWKEMQAHKPKIEGNEAPVSQNAKSHKAKVQGNEGPHSQNIRQSMPKRPKWTEIKAQKAKMKGNRGAKDQNERNCALQGRTRPKQGMTRPKRPK